MRVSIASLCVFSVLALSFGACSSKAVESDASAVTQDGTDATNEAKPLTEQADESVAQEAALGAAPVDTALVEAEPLAVSPEIPADVRQIEELEEDGRFTATWTSCETDLATQFRGTRDNPPAGRLLWHGDRLFVLTRNDEGALKAQRFSVTLKGDVCRVSSDATFASGGTLGLPAGAIDADFVGDFLVTAGGETVLYNADGAKQQVCANLPALTRIRAAQGNKAWARTTGNQLLQLSVSAAGCELLETVELAQDEWVGMQYAALGDKGLLAVMQFNNKASSLSYLESGKVQWRLHKDDAAVEARANLISDVFPMGGDAMVIRSLPQVLEWVRADGRVNARLSLRSAEGPANLEYPVSGAEMGDTRAIVLFREHERGSEEVLGTFRVLQLVSKR